MRDIFMSLRFASNTFNRVFLATASSLYAILTAIGPDLSNSGSVLAYQALVLSSGTKWPFAALFGLNAFCIWWRLFDRRPRVIWAAIINVFTAVLWSSLTAAEIYIYGRPLPDSVGEIMITFVAFFSAVRTLKTENDRVTA